MPESPRWGAQGAASPWWARSTQSHAGTEQQMLLPPELTGTPLQVLLAAASQVGWPTDLK